MAFTKLNSKTLNFINNTILFLNTHTYATDAEKILNNVYYAIQKNTPPTIKTGPNHTSYSTTLLRWFETVEQCYIQHFIPALQHPAGADLQLKAS